MKNKTTELYWDCKCDFCGYEGTFRIFPPDKAAIEYDIPTSFSGPTIDRCVRCQTLCCAKCASKTGQRCPKCGDVRTELAFLKELCKRQKPWWKFW